MRSFKNSPFFLRIKPTLRKFVSSFYFVFNLFYLPLLRVYFCKKIKTVPKSTQLLLLARHDFGTFPILLHYARCWQEQRGPVCVVVLTSQGHLVRQLAKIICPDVQLISANHFLVDWIPRLFSHGIVQFETFNQLYCHISCRWPHALFIFEQGIDAQLKESVSNYISYFDEHLQKFSGSQTKEFLKTYLNAREVLDYRYPVYCDWVRLHYAMDLTGRLITFNRKSGDVFEQLEIKGSFVILNINCKEYGHPAQNRKKIVHPERYDALINFLISRGYLVVVQGRSEQPSFASRPGLIDYSKTDICSIENDLKLYSRAEFAILSKTGAELLATVCNTPTLILNSVELSAMQPNPKYRYFPKHLWDRQAHRHLSWDSLLKDPCFFDIGKRNYNPNVEYMELEERELIAATEEFLQLLNSPLDKWLNYTPNQHRFMQSVTPLHMDLHLVKGVPCEAYLACSKRG